MFINSSNELGQFESGVMARLLGVVPSVVFGGCMTIAVVMPPGSGRPACENGILTCRRLARTTRYNYRSGRRSGKSHNFKSSKDNNMQRRNFIRNTSLALGALSLMDQTFASLLKEIPGK